MTRVASPRFPTEALAFLRALKRHNDREWFRARTDAYERCLKQPMLALIDRLAIDLPSFAPDLVASPRLSLYRIYRDTRFSEDKSPLKTHVAAVFPCRGLGKHAGAGLYLEVNGEHTLIAGGIYAPQTSELQALRDHLAVNWKQFQAITESPAFQRAFGRVSGDALRRVPRGFPPDHPAAEYLKLRQFLVAREFPARLATTTRFYATLLRLFRQMGPFVRFLNEPLLHAASIVDPLRRAVSGDPDALSDRFIGT
jgi:uncharacterized protein (TIGR02453 family)